MFSFVKTLCSSFSCLLSQVFLGRYCGPLGVSLVANEPKQWLLLDLLGGWLGGQGFLWPSLALGSLVLIQLLLSDLLGLLVELSNLFLELLVELSL